NYMSLHDAIQKSIQTLLKITTVGINYLKKILMTYIEKYLKIRNYKKACIINTYNCQFWTIFLFLSRLFFFLYNFLDWLFERIVLSPAAAVLFTAPTLHSLLLL